MATRLLDRLPFWARRAVLHGFGRYAPWEPGFDFTPPALGPGQEPGPPDFVGIGAQKAGTTWWYSLIAAHPGVTSRPDIHKERHFFSRFGAEPFSSEDVKQYQGWFPRVKGTIAGEWTPDYFSSPWVAPLLVKAAPKTRLLIVLRDPVDRFRSGLSHELANGAKLTSETVSEVINRGFYHRHLTWWRDHFDEDSFLILQYERCVTDPKAEIARTYRFLDLDDSYVPPNLDVQRATTTRSVTLARDVESRLSDIYAADVSSLAQMWPELDMSLWANLERTLHA